MNEIKPLQEYTLTQYQMNTGNLLNKLYSDCAQVCALEIIIIVAESLYLSV